MGGARRGLTACMPSLSFFPISSHLPTHSIPCIMRRQAGLYFLLFGQRPGGDGPDPGQRDHRQGLGQRARGGRGHCPCVGGRQDLAQLSSGPLGFVLSREEEEEEEEEEEGVYWFLCRV